MVLLSMNIGIGPFRLLLALLGMVLAGAFLAAPLEADAAPRPVLLLIHGGGFFAGGPEAMDYAATIAAADGRFVTVQPVYPLDDLAGAFERVKEVALDLRAQGRRVYAYGDSAGGAIAAWLASRGYVRAAAAKSPPTALRAWRSRYARHYAAAASGDPHSWRHLKAGPRVLRSYSSANRPSQRPLLILQSCEDTVVPCAMNIGFARRDPRVSLARVWGQHGDPVSRAYSFRRGLRWLAHQAG